MKAKTGLKIYGVVLATVFAANAGYQYGTQEEVTFTVNKMTEKISGKSSKYLVSATLADGSKEVFQNTDTFFHLKFDSSDLQLNKLEEGKTYRADVYGWRIGFFSTYRNILDVKEVQGNITPSMTAPKSPKF